MAESNDLPKYDELLAPTLQSLKKLGGSGSIEEIDETLGTLIGARQDQWDLTYAKSGAAILPDRMSWARSHLKLPGFISNPTRGVWVLTEAGRAVADKSNAELKKLGGKAYRDALATRRALQASEDIDNGQEAGAEGGATWNDRLLQLVQTMDPAAFERLCQRLLRESGFTRVEVSGKSGDGGIDGAGVLRMNLISFQVLFQCKRWKGSVGPDVVRNFRGAMQGRADKGLIITTGTFTSDARKEATRDGAPAIDLIDGEALCELLMQKKLGVRIEERTVTDIVVDKDFFASI